MDSIQKSTINRKEVKMDAIKEITEFANSMNKDLEILTKKQNLFCQEISLSLEDCTWETLKLTNEIKRIRQLLGG
jgi:hypothetical protein